VIPRPSQSARQRAFFSACDGQIAPRGGVVLRRSRAEQPVTADGSQLFAVFVLALLVGTALQFWLMSP
jgi:hypothetical protein